MKKFVPHLYLAKQPTKVFLLPDADSSNKVLDGWIKAAGIEKHITWSCARLSFSVLLQDKNVDNATVAYLMGHTTTDLVQAEKPNGSN
ncbi:hypothetical protein [Niastella sp. OAS944]|uniref:hypothetical protein n=1 Tax=Niastella sp. OAS944 TaxID=2664089 RepID=UPI0035C7DE4D|nr:site-specific recombinase XerD [Chitinophagaceae bacterium OAS944]